MRAGCAIALMLGGCSFAMGTPTRYGLPSSDPSDYAYTTGPTCWIYEKTAHIDTIVTIASAVVSISGLVFDTDELAIGGAAIGAPFFLSAVAGTIGKMRCQRWYQELPIGLPGDLVAAHR